MDETGADYTEWSKPERKTPMQYITHIYGIYKDGLALFAINNYDQVMTKQQGISEETQVDQWKTTYRGMHLMYEVALQVSEDRMCC